MLLPPVQLTTCPHPAAPRTLPDNSGRLTAERLRAVPCTAEWVVDTAPPPAHVAELTVAATEVRPPKAASPVGVLEAGAQHPTTMHVEPEQVPGGQGSPATQKRPERRIRGGNC